MVLDDLGLAETVDIAGIAKSRVKANVRGKTVERTEERFFLPGRKNPVQLRRGSAALFMLERLRDEAHRFAITYHRKLRSRAQIMGRGTVQGNVWSIAASLSRMLIRSRR